MQTATYGDHQILKQPYTRFQVHYMDLNKLLHNLDNKEIPYFAMEHRVNQEVWILHIPDRHRAAFDKIMIRMKLNTSAMNQSMWYQYRDIEARSIGLKSKWSINALIIIVLVLAAVCLLALYL